jgi:Beta-galactosidase
VRILGAILIWGLVAIMSPLVAQETVIVRPKEIDDVLNNPGIGFTTFQRFNGDRLNSGKKWTEGYPVEYQEFNGSLENPDYPASSISYFRVYWKCLEPKAGDYDWDLLDKVLRTARQRGQTLMLRVPPYGTDPDNDVPAWYRELLLGEPSRKLPIEKWRVDPEDRLYVEHFGGAIRAIGKRYDGHPDLELVDVSIIGAWGEEAGSDLLTQQTRKALLDAYLDSFERTPLVLQLKDSKASELIALK